MFGQRAAGVFKALQLLKSVEFAIGDTVIFNNVEHAPQMWDWEVDAWVDLPKWESSALSMT